MKKVMLSEERLRRMIRTMTPRMQFFKILRDELRALKRWKNLPRGRPRNPKW